MKISPKKLVFLCFALLLCITVSPKKAYAASMNPSITSISQTKKGLTLVWKGSAKSSSYIVYRKSGSGSYQKLATLKSSIRKYKDMKIKSGKRYTYMVRNVYGKKKYDSKASSFDAGSFVTSTALSLTKKYGSSTQKAVLKWKASKGSSYAVMVKKGSGGYKKVATVKAKSSKASYTVTKLSSKTKYKFNVKKTASAKKSSKKITSLKGKATVTVKDVNNSNITISWTKISGVTGYYIYRKVAGHGYRKIATVKASVRKFTDVFSKTVNSTDASYMNTTGNTPLYRIKYFIDPSMNPFVYVVRGYKKSGKKVILSSYSSEGSCKLGTPVITNVLKSGSTATIVWGKVPGADGYYLYEKVSNSWKHVQTVTQSSTALNGTLSKSVSCSSGITDFAVRAYRKQNGKIVLASSYASYTTSKRKYSGKKIMFIGDSITFGTPYLGADKDIFSFPYKVSTLTGAEIYNTGIPSATISYQQGAISDCLINSVINPISTGANMKVTGSGVSYAQRNNTKGYTFADFDVIVINIGTNDFTGNRVIGEKGNNWDSGYNTFYAGVNKMLSTIKAASAKRVAAGKSPIKVVYMNLLYRERWKSYIYNYTGENEIGQNISAYQAAINNACKSYNSSTLPIYQMTPTDSSGNAVVSGKAMNNGYSLINPKDHKTIAMRNVYYSTTDNLHPTRTSYSKMAESLVSFMISKNILK